MLHDVGVVVQLHQLGALDTQVLGPDEYDGVGAVHYADLDVAVAGDVKGVPAVAGGEQLAGAGASGVHEVHVDTGAGTGYALDLLVTVDHGVTVLHPDVLLNDLVGVGVQHPDHGDGLHGGDQALVDGEGTHGGGNVAAVGLFVHIGDLDIHLAEGVVHVHVRAVGFGDDGDLAGGGDGAAHAVDLLDVGGAHDLQEDLIPLGLVLGQVLLVENHGLAGAAAHIDAGILFHIHRNTSHFVDFCWFG